MLNPIAFTEKVVSDFLKYQLTAYPFADPNLYGQMRRLLNLEETRNTPLMKGPYISLSRAFREGARISDLVADGMLHPLLPNLAPHPRLYGHQETAIRAITQGGHALISTGTGSGKTECFLYPIISRCLKIRDENVPEGIVAVIVYPMNALAEDQLERLRDLLAGTGISFGMYIGKTPEKSSGVTGTRLPQGSSRADYRAALKERDNRGESYAVHPFEERASREEMRAAGKQPRILLTNVKQLELLLTRGRDVALFDQARLNYLVFDEAHTFRGAIGAETACLIRRLRSFCGKEPNDTVCIATSATIVDPERGPEAGRDFASRFFGVERNSVSLIGEEYQPHLWAEERMLPQPVQGDAAAILKRILETVGSEDPDVGTIVEAYTQLSGTAINADAWSEQLYDAFSRNELIHQLEEILRRPKLLSDVVKLLSEKIERSVSEEELLCWLALGTSAIKNGSPFVRPIVHAFVRGVGSAVVTFPEDLDGPRLWLSGDDAFADETNRALFRLPVLTCTTCGQHYFAHEVQDFEFFEKHPQGGEAVGDRSFWRPLTVKHGGKRLVLLDKVISAEEGEEEGEEDGQEEAPRGTAAVFMCRFCGAFHPNELERCDHCGRQGKQVRLWAVKQKSLEEVHQPTIALPRCVACNTQAKWRPGGYREPARPIRAITVSDVHVLAQNVIHRSERKRLLVFADNRQEAAFQAGWMQDHARRYRLRALMYERISQGAVSVGDLTAYLDDVLERDDSLSRSLVPEVWRAHAKEAEGTRHQEERHYYLRIQVLREITAGAKQRVGLEPWGRMQIVYAGVRPDLDFVRTWSERTGVPPDSLCEGIATVLDVMRRGFVLLDRRGQIFTHYWRDGDREVMRGYLPIFRGVPKGVKLRRELEDEKNRIDQWISERGDTLMRQYARRWGVPTDLIGQFLTELWTVLTEELQLLVSVTLQGSHGNAMPGCRGAHQIDADRLRLSPHTGIYRCTTCRRTHTRATPNLACVAWRCEGTMRFEAESPDDYDLMVLDHGFAMLRAREHSAQVPAQDREILERMFKSETDSVNTLVCTPTLELGVDIGSLDSTLMRNVPPLPSNYWQRAGRAGRRHRLAVNMTYARPASHDRAYFKEPLRLLAGVIYPPRFNLRNTLMVRKPVHATVLTTLFQLVRSDTVLNETDREEVKRTLAHCFPQQVKGYLFTEQGHIRNQPLDVSQLTTAVTKHAELLAGIVHNSFRQGWPVEDIKVVDPTVLRSYVEEMGQELTKVIRRLFNRVTWARNQMDRLEDLRRVKGVLEPEQEVLRTRCHRYIMKMRGDQQRRRKEAEGVDDTNTYAVLAVEGFLPGYGLETGSILASAIVPRGVYGVTDFDLPRASTVALREYCPGTLIYANANIFVPRYYHLEAVEPIHFNVDTRNEAVSPVEEQAGVVGVTGAQLLPAIPICDVDMPHQSHITDEDDYRFQPAVAVYGYELGRHNGGHGYRWNNRGLLHRYGVHLRLVNVGSSASSGTDLRLGYPVCRVCGQARSPFASAADLQGFFEDHRTRCGHSGAHMGFYTDVVADCLSFQALQSREEAYSLVESIRMAAANVLDMEPDDLQLLVIASPGVPALNLLLYDPMPGGSGLLDQIIENWTAVRNVALELTSDCPSACDSACIDCLYTFRNAYYHRHLNRHTARSILTAEGESIVLTHDLPPIAAPNQNLPEDQGSNSPEEILRQMLLRAGFSEPVRKRIALGGVGNYTNPDFFYEDPSGRRPGICIFLDGMGTNIHGNPITREQDRRIREDLEFLGYVVIAIPYRDLFDRGATANHFYRLGRFLLDRDEADRIRGVTNWFDPKGL